MSSIYIRNLYYWKLLLCDAENPWKSWPKYVLMDPVHLIFLYNIHCSPSDAPGSMRKSTSISLMRAAILNRTLARWIALLMSHGSKWRRAFSNVNFPCCRTRTAFDKLRSPSHLVQTLLLYILCSSSFNFIQWRLLLINYLTFCFEIQSINICDPVECWLHHWL
jgi:hypothetical protein